VEPPAVYLEIGCTAGLYEEHNAIISIASNIPRWVTHYLVVTYCYKRIQRVVVRLPFEDPISLMKCLVQIPLPDGLLDSVISKVRRELEGFRVPSVYACRISPSDGVASLLGALNSTQRRIARPQGCALLQRRPHGCSVGHSRRSGLAERSRVHAGSCRRSKLIM
jgi:hypothetical protein